MLFLTCHACPVQFEGSFPDGRMWYFRARWDSWSFSVSKIPTTDVGDAVEGLEIFHGDVGEAWGFGGSWLPIPEAIAIVQSCIRAFLDGAWRLREAA